MDILGGLPRKNCGNCAHMRCKDGIAQCREGMHLRNGEKEEKVWRIGHFWETAKQAQVEPWVLGEKCRYFESMVG
jgi:hypothetical protein